MTARTLHLRCTTWEQVETFYTRKLRRGKILSMKVPFAAAQGSAMTLGLELPNGLVVAIDGNVVRASAVEGATDKTWIELELVGLTDDILARIKGMAAGDEPLKAPTSGSATNLVPPRRDSAMELAALPADERALFQHLTGELKRLRVMAVHDVLGVDRDADADEIRRGWMALVRRVHPDLVARRGAPAITHLAEELTILCNRAYDRLRAALVAEGRGNAVGPALVAPPGWLVGFEDLSSAEKTPMPIAAAQSRGGSRVATIPPFMAKTASGSGPNTQPSSVVQGGEAFETRARAMLSTGDAQTAREVLAAALCVYPRSKPLRSLYYVASALSALQEGEVMLATSQLETALAHHESCVEAAAILEHIRKHGSSDAAEMQRLFVK
jgi:hypothetical protein